ncbi:DUF262 domain-containing protein [Bacillus toyonensis]|uniref:DUF262 domain-containing protein n=1 Tax=Bacillus toyonensis TaxID=155322 RepID=UPI0021CE038D|nr:DUF262 domain-containing protein [Bacillus toyonensis]MCU5584461.1 DUF262 domain-containing protein [Bacillus toyonensis]
MCKKRELTLNRSSNNLTISEFYENETLYKYNYDAKYQRRGDAWSIEKQSFLIDSIMKNYPIPPIFLHAKVDEDTGKTIYDVIDGKQRLTSIIKFINDEIELPENFGDDEFGSEALNGLKFSEIDKGSIYKKNFWRYVIPIEYVDTEEEEVIDRIFDRLNRNGEPLNPQELRHAKYNNSNLIRLVEELTSLEFWKARLGENLKFSRMENDEFISELLFTLLEDELIESKPAVMDVFYEKWSEQLQKDEEKCKDVKKRFIVLTELMQELDLDYEGLKIKGVSHLYGLWSFVKHCSENKIGIDRIKQPLQIMFNLIKNKELETEAIKMYKESMSHSTKSKHQRRKRMNALIRYCDL